MSKYMLESMFSSTNRSSPVPTVVMQPQTIMLPPPCLTVGKAQFFGTPHQDVATHARYHLSQTSLPKTHQTTGHVPVIHALVQVVFSKLFGGFFVSQLQKRLPSGKMAMQTDLLQCVAYGLSTDKLTFCF